MRFELLRGQHGQIEHSPTGPGKRTPKYSRPDENGHSGIVGYRTTYAALSAKRKRTMGGGELVLMCPQPGFSYGDEIVESDVDLVARFGAEKFRRLDGADPAQDPFQAMTEEELRLLAAEENIPLGKSVKGRDAVLNAVGLGLLETVE